MKKLFASLLLGAALTASAAERITILWGFSPASNTANMLRAVAKEANSQQSKYEFVVIDKQGGGGSIAANSVLQNPANQIYAATGSFFIRPNFNRESGYDVDRFQLVGVPATSAPIALYCKKYKTVAEIQQATDVTIADSGKGAMLNLINSVFTSQYANTRMVHYGTNYLQTLVDVTGGHVDCAWHWVSDVEQRVAAGNGHVVGITGLTNVQGFNTLKSQRVTGMDQLTSNTGIFASTEMSPEKTTEIRLLLAAAARSDDVKKLVQREYGTTTTLIESDYKKWFNEQNMLWKKIITTFNK
jgi:tripartite-type tricarboxylate transporter receptor subunit TctC